jgi:hypothetical protein
MKSFSDFRKSIASVGKKKEERKPQKAMDAGARGRRMLQRREYAAKVSAFIPDELKDHYEIDESSLARIKSKSDKGGIATLSASRGDKSAKENRARAKQLDKDIRGKGLPGATKVTGSYVEKGDDGKEKKVKERSHVVTSGKMGKRKFKKAVKALGKKYGQDSVLTQTKKTGTLVATRKGGLGKAKRIGVGKFKPQGKNPEGQSQIKGKTFTYESYLRIQERGKTYTIVLSWRGKLITTQMFIASFKRPTKAEMTIEVQKVYPTAIVMYFNPSMRDPSKPMLFAGQET